MFRNLEQLGQRDTARDNMTCKQYANTKHTHKTPRFDLGSSLNQGPILGPQCSTASLQKDPKGDPNIENYPSA